MFQKEADTIRGALGERVFCVEHVGSTSVPDLPAKPVIDIVLVVADSAAENEYAQALENAGYRLCVREPEWYAHRLFKGRKHRVNLHVFSAGCPEIERMLTFRNWLRMSKADRELYACSKQCLTQRNWVYTDDYADAKTEIIKEIMSRALDGENPMP
jgi:GrpB-like predicted nucleotidyltransferase (UPF0157 family)